MADKYPKHLTTLITLLKKLPGVGKATAERFSFQLLKWSDDDLKFLGEIISDIKTKITFCSECGCILNNDQCNFCSSLRDPSKICIISSLKDVFSIEQTRTYSGLYHIISSLLSPIDGVGFEGLKLEKLKERIKKHNSKEIIIALDSTLEGDATAFFLKQELQSFNVKISRLAFGVPVGSCLDLVDGSTLAKALDGRQSF